MQITLTLRGSLTGHLPEHLPAGSSRRSRRVEVAEGATIAAALDALRVPRELVHLVLLNGERVAVGQLATTALRPEDQLAVWPPLSGG